MHNADSSAVKQARINAWLTKHNQFLSKDELNFLRNLALTNKMQATQSSLINQLEDAELDFLDSEALGNQDLEPFHQYNATPNIQKILIYVETINLSYEISKGKDNNQQSCVETVTNNLRHLDNAGKIFYLKLILSEENKALQNMIDTYYNTHQSDGLYYLMAYIEEISSCPQTCIQMLKRLQFIQKSNKILSQDKSTFYLYLDQVIRQINVKLDDKLFYHLYFSLRVVIIIEEMTGLTDVDKVFNAIEKLRAEFGQGEDLVRLQSAAYEALTKLSFSDIINVEIIVKLKKLSFFKNALYIEKLDFLALYFEIKSIVDCTISLSALCIDLKFTNAWNKYIAICHNSGANVVDVLLHAKLLGVVIGRYLLMPKNECASLSPAFIFDIAALPNLTILFESDAFKKSYHEVLVDHPDKMIVMNHFSGFYFRNTLDLSVIFKKAKSENLSFSTIVNDIYPLMSTRVASEIIIEYIFDWFLFIAKQSDQRQSYLEIAKTINCLQERAPASSLFFIYRRNQILSYYDKLNFHLTGRYQSIIIQDGNDEYHESNEAFRYYHNAML